MPPPPFRWTYALLLAAALTALGCGRGDAEGESTGSPERMTFRGTVMETARVAAVVLVEGEDGRVWSVSTAQNPPVASPEARGFSVRDLLPGMPVEVAGEAVGDSFRPDSLRLLAVPPVLVVQPRERMALVRPVVSVEGYALRGRAVRYRLLHGGDVLAEGPLPTETLGVRRYGAFSEALPLGGYGRLGSPLVLEVWAEGEEGEPVRRELRAAGTRTLALYFPSRSADPERVRCDNVYPVHRPAEVMASPEEVVRLLIGGPEAEAQRRGFFSELAAFPDVRSVAIEGDSARVDLAAPTGGGLDACAAEAAEAQLRRTLGETFGVEGVRVTAGGRPLAAR